MVLVVPGRLRPLLLILGLLSALQASADTVTASMQVSVTVVRPCFSVGLGEPDATDLLALTSVDVHCTAGQGFSLLLAEAEPGPVTHVSPVVGRPLVESVTDGALRRYPVSREAAGPDPSHANWLLTVRF